MGVNTTAVIVSYADLLRVLNEIPGGERITRQNASEYIALQGVGDGQRPAVKVFWEGVGHFGKAAYKVLGVRDAERLAYNYRNVTDYACQHWIEFPNLVVTNDVNEPDPLAEAARTARDAIDALATAINAAPDKANLVGVAEVLTQMLPGISCVALAIGDKADRAGHDHISDETGYIVDAMNDAGPRARNVLADLAALRVQR